MKINLFGVLVITIVQILLGMLWYSKYAFGDLWSKLALGTKKGLNLKKCTRNCYVSTLASAFLTSLVIAISILATNTVTVLDVFVLVLIVWIGFVLPMAVNEVVYEKKPLKLVAINSGYYFVTFLLSAIIFFYFEF